MLYGVGIGLAKQHLTLEAVDVIKRVDEVIVPGKMAYEVVREIREPRIVEFPMGRGEDVARELAAEIAEKSYDVAFCCIGDPCLYSTFAHLVSELRKIDPDYPIKIVPGISSVAVALAVTQTFVTGSALIATQDFEEADVAIVLKVKNPRKAVEKLKKLGFSDFFLLERLFMDGERISREIPERADYFSVLVARR
ncbi:MAG: SAM-dependent methyltransferase [Archaeoglobaceae archaeon]